MVARERIAGTAVVLQPDDGPSFWQPGPANGYAHVKVSPQATGFDVLSMGYQTISPGGRVRPHSHDSQIELQICFRGAGRLVADGIAHDLVPGTTCFLGYDVVHEIINDSPQDDLVMLWVISPPGLEDFFAAVGRERAAGETAPEPFARPDDVVAIEQKLGFRDTG